MGVGGPPPKALTLFKTKICDIPYPIYDLTKNSKPNLCCKLKISLAQKYSNSREKRLHGKTLRIQSSHLRFRIQNLRRHDQTGMFSFRIHPLVCKRQNQSGTKTFRIPRGGTPRKIGCGWAARLPKPLPYL